MLEDRLMKEKTKIGYMLITFCSVLLSTQAYCNLIKSIEVDWLSLSYSAQKMIVQNYVNVLDSFALAIPIVGGDTESTWACWGLQSKKCLK